MKIKICGITNVEDALMAIDAGADMLGYNFYPQSKRYITPQVAAEIQAGVHQAGLRVTTVGVFVNVSVEEITRVLATSQIDLAQLSGDEPPEMVTALGGRGFKGVRPRNVADVRALAARYANIDATPALLLDAHHAGAYGGTGRKGDWAAAKSLAPSVPFLLAGGLTPGNVADAIEQVHPWGVDVASGVELDGEPRRKDFEKIKKFITAAKGVAHE